MVLVGRSLGCVIVLVIAVNAAPKPHLIAFGKWTTILWRAHESGDRPVTLRIRPLVVDGRKKELTLGTPHEVTEHTFVVQRIYRLNDSLPQEPGPPEWQWQLGGWLLVDRVSGRIQQIALPGFDPEESSVSWFRDYAGYCGISGDGRKVLAMIMQLGQRKPLLKKAIRDADEANADQSQQLFAAPLWERHPVRASFEIKPDQKLVFAVESRSAEAATQEPAVSDNDEEGGD